MAASMRAGGADADGGRRGGRAHPYPLQNAHPALGAAGAWHRTAPHCGEAGQAA